MRRSWWMDAKMYELYVDKFAGDFRGLIAKLDYFNHLGINALHILPHYPSPMVDDGYDISDYENVRSELGTLQDFSAFVEAAHARGIQVITDLVVNHTSDQHPWFTQARSSKNNATRDYFLWSETGGELKQAINAFPDFKSINWIWNEATQDYYYATFYPGQPDLNWDNPKVLEEVLAHIDFWVGKGVDGFRLDAIPHLVEREDHSSYGLPETHDIVTRMRRHVDERYGSRIALLAEVNDGLEETKRYFSVGDECQMIYHFPLMGEMLLGLMREDYSRVENMARTSWGIPSNCQWATFLRNHDEVYAAALSKSEQQELNHALDPDQYYQFHKGERASVRLATVFKGDEKRLLKAFELLYSLPGAPIMYYGDEIGMQNLPLREDIIDSRKYVRGDFDWRKAELMLKDPDSLLNKTAEIIKQRKSEFV